VADVNRLSNAHKNQPHSRDVLVSFDGGEQAETELMRPDRLRFWDQPVSQHSRISRGAGLSYVAASFGAESVSVSHEMYNRILGFDSKAGLVEVETGMTLLALHEFLSKRGFYLPVLPGYGQITVGGCVAADVHGKNHVRDGTFTDQVAQLQLFHPNHGLMEVSREKEAKLFALTCGGYGLTGHIVSVCLKVSKLPGRTVMVTTRRFADDVAGLKMLQERSATSDFVYTWHDCAPWRRGFGDGIFFEAHFVNDEGKLTSDALSQKSGFSSKTRKKLRFNFINQISQVGINKLFRMKNAGKSQPKQLKLEDALFPIHGNEIYFQLFGSKGFCEYQALLPLDACEEYIDLIEFYVKQKHVTVSLASAKAFKGPQRYLQFSGRGICLAINVPRSKKSIKLLEALDSFLIEKGGRPNIIKDSRLQRNVVDACYPEADQFRNALADFDPNRIFQSSLSKRLGL